MQPEYSGKIVCPTMCTHMHVMMPKANFQMVVVVANEIMLASHRSNNATLNNNAMMLAAQRKNFEAGTALQDYNQAQAQDVTPLAA